MMKLSTFRFWRTLIPFFLLLATAALLAKFTYPLPAYTEVLLWYTRLDPFLLISDLRHGVIPGWAWLPITLLLFTLLAGRFFCGWLCPLGGLLALLNQFKNTAPPAWSQKLLPYRFPWLLFLLAVLFFGSGWTMFFSPFHLLTEELTRLFAWQIPWMLLLVVLLGLLISPRFWCVHICPTGLLLSLFSRWRIFRAAPPVACIHCGICENICPTGAADPTNAKTSADCLLCGRCSEKCPAGYFEFVSKNTTPVTTPCQEKSFTRREVLRSGAALAVAGAASPLMLRPTGANPLRPPGAIDEAEFLSRCSRCGRCIKVCPSKCIQAMPLSSGPALFLTPYIVAREARCELTQHCQKVCPTGAIAQVPIANALMGLAEIDHSRCLGWAEGKLCLLCQEQCPQHAIDSDEKDRPTVRTELCVGCGACENGCPIDSPAAIVVKPQPSRRR